MKHSIGLTVSIRFKGIKNVSHLENVKHSIGLTVSIRFKGIKNVSHLEKISVAYYTQKIIPSPKI